MGKNNELQGSNGESQTPYVTAHVWQTARPHIMIVACSDGRYQRSLDEFLNNHLGITHYDRLYAPGGPGAMASSAHSYLRGEQFRQESAFLVDAHGLQQIIFIFHGPVNREGPMDATCADYRRKMHDAATLEIYRQQEEDLQEAVAAVLMADEDIKISAFRAEVQADLRVQFVPIKIRKRNAD